MQLLKFGDENSFRMGEIIIDRVGPVFMAFVGNNCLRIYIPTIVHTSICFINIKIVPIT